MRIFAVRRAKGCCDVITGSKFEFLFVLNWVIIDVKCDLNDQDFLNYLARIPIPIFIWTAFNTISIWVERTIWASCANLVIPDQGGLLAGNTICSIVIRSLFTGVLNARDASPIVRLEIILVIGAILWCLSKCYSQQKQCNEQCFFTFHSNLLQ